MSRSHPITRDLAIVAALVVAISACTTAKEIRTASQSAYDADFAIVYSEALAATRELYPNLDEDPTTGVIKTAWHQVQFSTAAEDPRSAQAGDPIQPGAGGGGGGAFTTPASKAYKRYFIRFDVSITGGRPWRVRVSGRAAEWEPGNAQPSELRGAAKPHWLGGRRDALTVAIYRRLRKFAVRIEEEKEEVVEEEGPPVDTAAFADIPQPAIDLATALIKAIERRDMAALRAGVADDVVWSFGAAGDADTAMAMWQADPETLAALAKALRAGCRKDAEAPGVISCPPAATEEPGYLGWRATLEERAGAWKLTAFVQGD